MHRIKETQQIITMTIQTYGIPPNLKGYDYLMEAVALLLQDPSIFVMQMYQIIAEKHNKSAANIERTMRYAIEITYGKNKLNHSFPYAFGRPSNSEVIWTIVESVKRFMLVSNMYEVTDSVNSLSAHHKKAAKHWKKRENMV